MAKDKSGKVLVSGDKVIAPLYQRGSTTMAEGTVVETSGDETDNHIVVEFPAILSERVNASLTEKL